MILLAAFQVLLARYSGQGDISIGSPIANRNREEIEDLIGFFVNTLVLRSDLSDNPTFNTLLKRVREVALGAYAHQDVPFEKLVEELQPERKLNQNSLFQVNFVLQNAPEAALSLPGLVLKPVASNTEFTRFDLELSMWEAKQGLAGTLIYNATLFEPATIARMISHWQTLLEEIVAQPERSIAELPLFTPIERQQMLVEWNKTTVIYPQDRALHQLLEEQVALTPDSIALFYNDELLTYTVLNQKANQLAHYLRRCGVGPDVLVGLYLERSPAMMIAILGILKAGGAYVPLDPSYPGERLAFLIQDTQMPVLLAQTQFLQNLPPQSTSIICLDAAWETIAQEPSDVITCNVTKDNLAYVIYTSGSTGRPKGVMISQRGAINYLWWCSQHYAVESGCGSIVHSSLAFDLTVTSLFAPLLTGRSVVLVPEEPGVNALVRVLQQWKHLSIVKVTPAHLDLLNQLLSAHEVSEMVQALIIGGEALTEERLTFWRQHAPQTRLINEYGPTETVVGCCIYEIRAEEVLTGDIPIGRPIANTQLYILDGYLQPVPIGVVGELYIGGDGVSRGYLRNADLTCEHFIPDEFSGESGQRLYRTGDRARYRPDGIIEYLGRSDQQVKIRGYRIETSEIEALLNQQVGVQESLVIAREDLPGGKQLVAYVIPDFTHQFAAVARENWQDEHVSQWQMLYEETYRDTSPSQEEPTFNIVGWNSSYTGEAIPAEEMREQIEQTVSRILVRKPAAVMEIGCGSGLLLLRIAPFCKTYYASDFSAQVIGGLAEQVSTLHLDNIVELRQRVAHDFLGIEAESYDAIILNSVVQYFPDIEYVARVLEEAIRTVKPGGFLFVGDIRSFPLQQAYCASVELFRASASVSRADLLELVQKRMMEEEELLIDPDFFVALQKKFPQISQVQIELKRGRAHNELTRFRYDVFIQVGSEELYTGNASTFDWQQDKLQLSTVKHMLSTQTPKMLCLRNVPNMRLWQELRTLSWLAQDHGAATVGELREMLDAQDEKGIDPEEIWDNGEQMEYAVKIQWSQEYGAGYYDALFVKEEACRESTEHNLLPWSGRKTGQDKTWQAYANNPLQAKMLRTLIPGLRSSLLAFLPEYMLPAFFVPLMQFPLTSNGKIDRRALPQPQGTKKEANRNEALQETPIEEILRAIWCDVLGLKYIGINDDFFKSGGHSLLATQLISRIRMALHVDLQLRNLFEHPTISELARHVEAMQRTSQGISMPPILPVSREQPLPLSFAQQRLWFLDQLKPKNASYNMPIATLPAR